MTVQPKSLKQRQDELRDAAAALAREYLQEKAQIQLDGLTPNPLAELPLETVLKDALYVGAIDAVIDHVRGNQSKAADVFGVNRQTLRTRLKRYGFFEPRRHVEPKETA